MKAAQYIVEKNELTLQSLNRSEFIGRELEGKLSVFETANTNLSNMLATTQGQISGASSQYDTLFKEEDNHHLKVREFQKLVTDGRAQCLEVASRLEEILTQKHCAEARIPQILDRFYRIDSATTPSSSEYQKQQRPSEFRWMS